MSASVWPEQCNNLLIMLPVKHTTEASADSWCVAGSFWLLWMAHTCNSAYARMCVCVCLCLKAWKAASWVTVLKACSPCWQVIHSCKGWTACQKWICFYQKVKRWKEKKERGEMSKSGFLESIKNLQQMLVIVQHDCRNHFNTGQNAIATGDRRHSCCFWIWKWIYSVHYDV